MYLVLNGEVIIHISNIISVMDTLTGTCSFYLQLLTGTCSFYLQLLVGAGCQKDITNKYGVTPLYEAVNKSL